MATQTIVLVTCDMPHREVDVPAAKTFELYPKAGPAGGREVDLCESCAGRLLVPVMAAGRAIAGKRVRK